MIIILQHPNARAPLNTIKREFLSSMSPLTTRDMGIYPLPIGDEVSIEIEHGKAFLNLGPRTEEVELCKGDRVIARHDGKADVIRTYG